MACGSDLLTLQELLACVFLEESLMGDWTRQVVDHELENWLDFSLIVSSVVRQRSILILVRQYQGN